MVTREGRGYSDDVMSQVPIPTPTETHTRECGYGFHADVGAGGPIFTHGLPVTGPSHKGRVVSDS